MRETTRVAALYFWLYTFVGIFAPFSGPYFASLGLGGAEMGVLGAVFPIAGAIVPPLWGAFADRLGETTLPLRIVTIGAAIALLPFPFVSTFSALFVVLVLFSVFRAGATPLADSVTLTMLEGRGGDYGRVRAWGSVGFLASSAIVAALADLGVTGAVALGLVASQALAGASVVGLPRVPRDRSMDLLGDLRALLSDGRFRWFLVATFVNPLMVMGPLFFYPVHMREQGLSNGTIAAFWWAGVLCEIILFRHAPRVVARIGLGALYLAAPIATTLRWGLLLVIEDPILVVAVQVLHAGTFGAFYYASVTWLARAVPLRLRASGQSIFAAVGFGIAGGLGTLVSGPLFATYGIDGVLGAAALMGVVATALSIPLARAMSRADKPQVGARG